MTGGLLDGQKVWNVYLQLQEIENFPEKKIQKSYINSLMQFFTFNIIKFNEKSRPCRGEEIGGYFFVEDTYYITEEGKFDREKFQEDCKSIFL